MLKGALLLAQNNPINSLNVVQRNTRSQRCASPVSSTTVLLSHPHRLATDKEQTDKHKVSEELLSKRKDPHTAGYVVYKKDILD